MHKFKVAAFILLLLFGQNVVYGQNDTTIIRPKNLVKFNLSPALVNSYVFQYERVISPKQSIALSFGFSPKTDLPFQKILLNRYGDNEDARNAIENTHFKKYNATLEYRFYIGRVAPAGFYIAPFLRYLNMQMNQTYRFTPAENQQHTAVVTGKFNGVGLGALLGYQLLIKKNFGFDFWIAGPFYGPTMKANFHGTDPVGNLTAEDQADLKNAIENGNIAGYKIKATISQNTSGPTTVDVQMNGPYYGVRALGVCLVYRF